MGLGAGFNPLIGLLWLLTLLSTIFTLALSCFNPLIGLLWLLTRPFPSAGQNIARFNPLIGLLWLLTVGVEYLARVKESFQSLNRASMASDS